MMPKSLALEDLRTDLIERWQRAFARVAEVKAKVPAGAETVYSAVPAFELSRFSPEKFLPGARLSRTPSAERDDYVFRLDARRWPLHVSYPLKRAAWQGVYRYSSAEVEQLEVCLTTGVPNHYECLTLSDGQVLAEQRFVCNMDGSDARLRGLPATKQTERILSDPHAYFLYLTLYRKEDGVTRSALEHHESGGDVHRTTLAYDYAADGTLQRIVQHWPGGEQRTTFAAKPKAPSAARGHSRRGPK